MTWILIISWAVTSGQYSEAYAQAVYRGYAVAMQEFNSVEACQFASIQAQRIAPKISVVCS